MSDLLAVIASVTSGRWDEPVAVAVSWRSISWMTESTKRSVANRDFGATYPSAGARAQLCAMSGIASARGLATLNRQRHSGDVGGHVTSKEQHSVGDFVGLAHTAHRHQTFNVLVGCWVSGDTLFCHRRLNRPRQKGVGPDVLISVLKRNGFR